MRKSDREITDIHGKLAIVEKCRVCRLGLSNRERPYIIPLNYGYEFDGNVLTLFFHSANEGKKLDIIKNNPKACFEVDCDTSLIENENSAKCSYAYKSVIGFGDIIIIEDSAGKNAALNAIVKHQTGKDSPHNFPDGMLQKVIVYKLVVNEFTGKQNPAP